MIKCPQDCTCDFLSMFRLGLGFPVGHPTIPSRPLEHAFRISYLLLLYHFPFHFLPLATLGILLFIILLVVFWSMTPERFLSVYLHDTLYQLCLVTVKYDRICENCRIEKAGTGVSAIREERLDLLLLVSLQFFIYR